MYQLDLYYFPECPYCQIVTEKIDQLKLSSLVKLTNIKTHEASLKKLIADTGRRTVPCLYINDKPMHESKLIIQWLEQNATKITSWK